MWACVCIDSSTRVWECICILLVGSPNVFVTCTTCVCVCTYICMHIHRYLCILLHNIIHKFSHPTHLQSDEGAQHVCMCAAIPVLGCLLQIIGLFGRIFVSFTGLFCKRDLENVLASFCMLIYINSQTLHTCRVMKVHDVCVWCTSRCRMLQPPPCSRRYWTSCWRYVMGSSITKRATHIANAAPRTGNIYIYIYIYIYTILSCQLYLYFSSVVTLLSFFL